jgi:hypothetical protein
LGVLPCLPFKPCWQNLWVYKFCLVLITIHDLHVHSEKWSITFTSKWSSDFPVSDIPFAAEKAENSSPRAWSSWQRLDFECPDEKTTREFFMSHNMKNNRTWSKRTWWACASSFSYCWCWKRSISAFSQIWAFSIISHAVICVEQACRVPILALSDTSFWSSARLRSNACWSLGWNTGLEVPDVILPVNTKRITR